MPKNLTITGDTWKLHIDNLRSSQKPEQTGTLRLPNLWVRFSSSLAALCCSGNVFFVPIFTFLMVARNILPRFFFNCNDCHDHHLLSKRQRFFIEKFFYSKTNTSYFTSTADTHLQRVRRISHVPFHQLGIPWNMLKVSARNAESKYASQLNWKVTWAQSCSSVASSVIILPWSS